MRRSNRSFSAPVATMAKVPSGVVIPACCTASRNPLAKVRKIPTSVQRRHKRGCAASCELLIRSNGFRIALTPHAWGTEGTEAARMMWVYGGPDPFADSTYLEGEPPKQHA